MKLLASSLAAVTVATAVSVFATPLWYAIPAIIVAANIALFLEEDDFFYVLSLSTFIGIAWLAMLPYAIISYIRGLK